MEPVGFTSQSRSWGYINEPHTPVHTARILDRLCDIRLPLTLAILDGMSIAVSGERYILPLSNVMQSLQRNEPQKLPSTRTISPEKQ